MAEKVLEFFETPKDARDRGHITTDEMKEGLSIGGWNPRDRRKFPAK